MRLPYILCYILSVVPLFVSAQAPTEFIQNKGQWDGAFEYRAATNRGDIFLEKNGFTYLLSDGSNHDKMDAYHHGLIQNAPVLRFHAYKVAFEGAATPRITGDRPQTTYYNYFLGNDSTRWKSGIHPYFGIDYKGLYPGIDMHVTSEKDNIIYDFIVQPNAAVTQIRERYYGAEKISLKKGNLIISTSVGDMQELKPYAYQYIDGERKEVNCNYVLEDNTISFSFPDDYDHKQLLIIDPTVVFCTFTGSTSDNWGFTATYDDTGNLYAGGIANGPGYPVTTGAFQVTYAGGYQDAFNLSFACDIAVIKYNPTGTNRIYGTYIGGKLNERPHSMIVDSAGNLIIAGRTKSIDYPVTPGAFQTTNHGGWDIIVTKLNPTATALVASTYVGGPGDDGVNYDSTEYLYGALKYNYGDDARSEVQIDKTGNVYVTGCTRSTGFPVTATATSSTLSGTQDGVVFKMNPLLSNMIWGTYLGGSGEDAGYVLAFDNAQQNLYVAGGTMSTNFPATAGTWHNTYQGGNADGFIVKFLNSAPYTIQKATFIGTGNYDQIYGIQVDASDNVYTMGQSLGGTFPVTSGVYNNANSSQFILKMDNNLATDLISTIYGSGDPSHTNISPVAFLVDTCDNVYISGWGGNLDITQMPATVGNCNGMPLTANANQSTTDGNDFYFICLNKNMVSLLYGSYFGRSGPAYGGEHVDGGTSRFDKNGVIYQAICGGCSGSTGFTPFPTTPGAWSTTDKSNNCNEAALKIAFEFGPVKASATAIPNARGCAPFTVQFQNTSGNALNYLWDFGDNTPTSTQPSPSHTFTSAGTYFVKLTANNSNACVIVVDSTILTVIVDTTHIHPSFTYGIIDSCAPYLVSFANTSQPIQSNTVFTWNFGDGSAVYTGTNPPNHTYDTGGTYTVTVIMEDTTACNSPDSASQTFSLKSARTGASFTSPDTTCRSSQVGFNNTSTNGQDYNWNFGDGGTSSSSSATHTYDSTGVYTVTLIVSNPGSCNHTDTFIKKLVVQEGPIADFTFQPSPPKTNQPITFTNQSKNALDFLWDLGDGTTTKEVNPVHMYTRTDNFNVCLTASNHTNCPSKICKPVFTDIVPLANIPTGFSPNGDGKNDILYVRGANILTLDLKIYNRWGQLVFETTSQDVGWDGTYNGKPQEMDAYAYILDVKFINGTSMHKQGNVTLLR